MHNAYLDIDGEKMSKSLGNVRTVRDLLARYRGEVLRFALLSAHYRSPLNFSSELLDQAENTLAGLYGTLRDVADVEAIRPANLEDEPFYQALTDDLNTPVAIAGLHALARALHKAVPADKPALKGRLLAAGELLGVLQQEPAAWLQGGAVAGSLDEAEIEALINERQAAKLGRDYARADAIREQLAEAGVVLEDSREGTRWRRA
jgi:cysteinyl-tRNA synthetase